MTNTIKQHIAEIREALKTLNALENPGVNVTHRLGPDALEHLAAIEARLDSTDADQPSVDLRKLARETCAKLIPHTTSVHNVEVVKGAITEAEARGYRRGLIDCKRIASTISGNNKDHTDQYRRGAGHVQAEIDALIEKETA